MVIVSSGFHRTHMTIAAQQAGARGMLDVAITGAYPTPRLKRNVNRLGLQRVARIARLLERDEQIPRAQLQPLLLPEILDEVARLVARIPILARIYPRLSIACFRLYAWFAGRELMRHGAGPEIYHFRAGFGHRSVAKARQLGLVVLCDHSAPHPALIDELVARRGRLEQSQLVASEPRHPLWREMLSDIDRSDAVVVNSNFLKETFVELGWPGDRVHVIYLGVDDHFLAHAAGERHAQMEGPLRLLFAGRFESAKGASVLMAALDALSGVDWELTIAGPVGPQVLSAHGPFFEDPRVTLLGTIDRAGLARQMKGAPVFVFPSFAEGSARVVFEALACGCYVITTPNAGSIVEDGVHGALVPPGDANELAKAIGRANENRKLLAEVGNRNARLVAEHFGQADYGNALADLYRRLLSTTPPV